MNTNWGVLHASYQVQPWIEKPSIFAETVMEYFPPAGKILELGAGHGQDSFFFAGKGYNVSSSDIEVSSLNSKFAKQPKSLQNRIEILQIDLNNPLPFEDESFDVVYAHMSLHYFDNLKTKTMFSEIKRVLKLGGIVAFLANSKNDPEYSAGTPLEQDFFLMNSVTKRYFCIESAKKFTQDFQVVLLDDAGRTYKDEAKGVSNLIRFIGRK